MNAFVETQNLLMRICDIVHEEKGEIEEIEQDKIAAMVPECPSPEFACMLLDNLINDGLTCPHEWCQPLS